MFRFKSYTQYEFLSVNTIYRLLKKNLMLRYTLVTFAKPNVNQKYIYNFFSSGLYKGFKNKI